jgi:hypothetical protein
MSISGTFEGRKEVTGKHCPRNTGGFTSISTYTNYIPS